MSTKSELELILKTLGYDLNPHTSKDSLVKLLHLHSKALKKEIDVSKMNDHELRYYLNQYDISIGPVIGHTRAIYQRQLLQAISNEIDEDMEDKVNDNNEKLGRLSMNAEDGIVTRSGRIVHHDRQ